MRKSTPQPAAKGSKQHKKNWTKTWDANVHYRHNAAGEISFATRTYNKGTRHYRTLQARTFEAARREAMTAQDEAENLPQVRDIPTVREYWEERVISAVFPIRDFVFFSSATRTTQTSTNHMRNSF